MRTDRRVQCNQFNLPAHESKLYILVKPLCMIAVEITLAALYAGTVHCDCTKRRTARVLHSLRPHAPALQRQSCVCSVLVFATRLLVPGWGAASDNHLHLLLP